MFRAVCCLCLTLLSMQCANSQDTLGDTLLRVADDRDKLVQYCVDVHGTGNFDYTGKARRARGLGDRARFEIDQHIEYSRSNNHAILAQRIKGSGEDGSWFLIGKSQGVSFLKEGNEFKIGDLVLRPLDDDEYACRCIDPRAIGLMSSHDITSARRSLDAILQGLLRSVGNEDPVTRQGDFIRFESPSRLYVFNLKRSFMPTEFRIETGGNKVHWKTELETIDGSHLPVRSSLELKLDKDDIRRVDFVLKWSSINKTVSSGYAAEERLRKLVEQN